MIYEMLAFGGVYFFGVLVGWVIRGEDLPPDRFPHHTP